jgi:sulfonate transport system permease protein
MPASDRALTDPMTIEIAFDPPPLPNSPGQARGMLAQIWRTAWPQLGAVAIAIAVWQLVVLTGWRPDYVLPGPAAVFGRLWHDAGTRGLWQAISITLQRAIIGYAIAIVAGTALGLIMVRLRVLRSAFGSMITGLQSMPSVAWFPLAILIFRLSEGAILFVVVLGAAPAIANGLLSGVDHIPPLMLRAGKVLGARGINLYTRVILPAALPGFVAGLKQGWAFAWRSLMAGELLVIIGSAPSLGVRLSYAREFSDAEELLASMIVVLLIGIIVDSLIFGAIEHRIRAHRGLIERTG